MCPLRGPWRGSTRKPGPADFIILTPVRKKHAGHTHHATSELAAGRSVEPKGWGHGRVRRRLAGAERWWAPRPLHAPSELLNPSQCLATLRPPRPNRAHAITSASTMGGCGGAWGRAPWPCAPTRPAPAPPYPPPCIRPPPWSVGRAWHRAGRWRRGRWRQNQGSNHGVPGGFLVSFSVYKLV